MVVAVRIALASAMYEPDSVIARVGARPSYIDPFRVVMLGPLLLMPLLLMPLLRMPLLRMPLLLVKGAVGGRTEF